MIANYTSEHPVNSAEYWDDMAHQALVDAMLNAHERQKFKDEYDDGSEMCQGCGETYHHENLYAHSYDYYSLETTYMETRTNLFCAKCYEEIVGSLDDYEEEEDDEYECDGDCDNCCLHEEEEECTYGDGDCKCSECRMWDEFYASLPTAEDDE